MPPTTFISGAARTCSGSRRSSISRNETELPRLARAADVLVVLLAAAAAAVFLIGGFHATALGVRLSISSPWRLLAGALTVLVLRHAWIQRPSLSQRLHSGTIPVPADAPRAPLATHAAVVLGFTALTCVVCFPQVLHPRSVNDLGDPLFSMWRLDWVAHQLLTDPVHLFDANIFHPEPRTLAYSDAMLVPGLIAAPFLWLGSDVVVVHNVLMLAATAFSGVTMFWLVRALTRCTGAAAVAGAVFSLYPLRWAFYANLELEMTLWMPLALLCLHRTMASGRVTDGIATGVTVALQALSSLYFGLFLSLHMFVVAIAIGAAARARLAAALRALALGAVVAGALVAPVAAPYFENRAIVGERRLADAARFSARRGDYLAAHPTSRVYGRALPGEGGKLELFPGLASPALAALSLWTPLGPGTLGYATALVVSADASLGVNGSTYPLLYRFVLPFRGLRAPDRFAVLVGFSLAVLAGYGVARMLRGVRRRSARIAIASAAVVLVAVEAAPVLDLTPVWTSVPRIYDALPAEDDVVIVDLPFPQRDGSTPGEYSFLYFATFHHKRLVNGGSGFYPPWYDRLAGVMRDFPNDAAMAGLKAHGAEYLVVHGYFYGRDEYARVRAALDARPDVRLAAVSAWNGAESSLYAIAR